MADEKDKVIKLEERLANAASMFKDMKSQMEVKERENEELKLRISELEDEIVINGGAKEEVEGLKSRLEKAKEIFSNQKTKIGELVQLNNEVNDQLTNRNAEIESLNTRISELEHELDLLTHSNDSMKKSIQQIKDIVDCYGQE